MKLVLFALMLVVCILYAGTTAIKVDGILYDSWEYLPDSTGVVITQEIYVDSIYIDTVVDTLTIAEVDQQINKIKQAGTQLTKAKMDLSDEYLNKSNEIKSQLDLLSGKLENYWIPIKSGLKK